MLWKGLKTMDPTSWERSGGVYMPIRLSSATFWSRISTVSPYAENGKPRSIDTRACKVKATHSASSVVREMPAPDWAWYTADDDRTGKGMRTHVLVSWNKLIKLYSVGKEEMNQHFQSDSRRERSHPNHNESMLTEAEEG